MEPAGEPMADVVGGAGVEGVLARGRGGQGLAAKADLPTFPGRAVERGLLRATPIEADFVGMAGRQARDRLGDRACLIGRIRADEIAAVRACGGQAIAYAVLPP